MAIVENSKGGLPIGVYGVLYYRLSSRGEVRREACSDNGVGAAYVLAAVEALGPDEALEATCQSQPGGLTAYGSEAVRAAMVSR